MRIQAIPMGKDFFKDGYRFEIIDNQHGLLLVTHLLHSREDKIFRVEITNINHLECLGYAALAKAAELRGLKKQSENEL